VALASLGTSLLELRMSGNEESAMSAFQSAQAGVDVITKDVLAEKPQIVIARGISGDVINCFNWPTACAPTIDPSLIPAPVNTASSQIKITQTVERGSVPRLGAGTSAKHFSAAYFEAESIFDKSGVGQGKAGVVHGYLQLLAGGAGGGGAPLGPQDTN